MQSRRDFLKQVGVATGGTGLLLSESIQRAFAIDPPPGSTFMDAEHVIILMQENRSFDHVFGTLRGVRGFDDPRAIELPNGNPVWLQTNNAGETFAPFRLDIKNTKVTWLGSLPHSWTDQVDARNDGKYDRWLDAKASGHEDCAGMPFTLGVYTREDVPFYFDLADAFTVCDQHFCSSLTGTMPNRLYLWSGTVRGVKDASARARVNNSDVEYEDSCGWKAFPDRLEEQGISWKVYQNEISAVDVGFEGEEAPWLANFGDNPLEWFPQFHVGFSTAHRKYLDHVISTFPVRIEELKKKLQTSANSTDIKKSLDDAERRLKSALERRAKFTGENFEKLSQRERNLHSKGLATNIDDPHYHELESLRYQDGGVQREMNIPKGDVLHQFRQDVSTGKLPTVSWLVAPENYSDHPGAAWFGAWYVSEVINILTKNPEVWRKTIFILTYDENDGYFDHVPPFVAPHPDNPETGATSRSIRTDEDFVTMKEELRVKESRQARESSIGLGYRVPMIIASPWSRGGYVCSQVFDHTSPLQFLERFLSTKTGKRVAEPNISTWRRTVCGDLTSSFRPYNGERISLPPFLKHEPFVESIHKAQFKPVPTGFKALTHAEIEAGKGALSAQPWMLRQERGQRPSTALPYELAADGAMNDSNNSFEITFAAGITMFGAESAGGAFNVYAPLGHKKGNSFERGRSWNFAVAAGETLKYSWRPEDFENEIVFLRVYGPNGFYREFRSDRNAPLRIQCQHQFPSKLILATANTSTTSKCDFEVVDNAYGASTRLETVPAGGTREIVVDAIATSGWHDISIRTVGSLSFAFRFAGRIETGKDAVSDPLIGLS